MIPRHSLRVTVSPAAEPVSLSEVRAQTRIDGAAEDGLVAGYILAARQHIERITGRAFVTQTLEMTLHEFPEDREFDLPRSPAQSVTSIQYLDSDGATQTFGSSNYVLDGGGTPARIALVGNASWPDTADRIGAVTVTYVAGYAGSIPEPIRHAIMLLAAHFYEHREAAAEKAMPDLPMGVRALLGTYETNWL